MRDLDADSAQVSVEWVRISVPLQPTLHQWLKTEARRMGVPASTLARMLILSAKRRTEPDELADHAA
jgi:hypothetical protein